MSETTAKKNLGIRATFERWERLNEIAFDRNTSVQKLVDAAIDREVFGTRVRRTAERVPDGEYQSIKAAIRRARRSLDEIERAIERTPPPKG